VADEIEQTVRAQLARAHRLRQAILKQAFEGKLVPQDSNDEPAGILLQRLRAAGTPKDTSSEQGRGKPAQRRAKMPAAMHGGPNPAEGAVDPE
jgi:type I restriction enzyme S subunit